ncbi:MAG: lytic transglycosylase domain-containing protein [Clostridia bacterium]|nr:lytic transglycosylase domain-containing protein [Clostridia bacterium]
MNKVITFLSIYIIGIIFVCALIIAVFLHFYPLKYRDLIEKYSTTYTLEPELVASVINAESGFDKNSVSNAGAIGLMQLLPSTAEYIANINSITYSQEKLFDPEYNICLGCAYLNYLIKKFDDINTALCAYNAGPGNVAHWLENPKFTQNGLTLTSTPFPATNFYLAKIRQNQQIYTKFF